MPKEVAQMLQTKTALFASGYPELVDGRFCEAPPNKKQDAKEAIGIPNPTNAMDAWARSDRYISAHPLCGHV